MTQILILGYIPCLFAIIALSFVMSTRGNTSAAARELGDRVGRRTGIDRRQSDLDFVGTDRRSGADRRGAVAATGDQSDQAERAA